MSGFSIGSATETLEFNAKSGTLSNVSQINGGATLTKNGTGTLILAGTSSYTGATEVVDGTLRVNGLLSNTAVTVGNSTTAALTPTLTGGIGGGNGGVLTTPANIPSLKVYAPSSTIGHIAGSVDACGPGHQRIGSPIILLDRHGKHPPGGLV